MTIRYSESTGTFYPLGIDYPSLPGDVQEVSKADYDRAMSRPVGHAFSFVDGALVITPPTPLQTAQQQNALILETIATIERNRQPRAQRDFALLGDRTRLQAIDDEIAALRAQLVR